MVLVCPHPMVIFGHARYGIKHLLWRKLHHAWSKMVFNSNEKISPGNLRLPESPGQVSGRAGRELVTCRFLLPFHISIGSAAQASAKGRLHLCPLLLPSRVTYSRKMTFGRRNCCVARCHQSSRSGPGGQGSQRPVPCSVVLLGLTRQLLLQSCRER